MSGIFGLPTYSFVGQGFWDSRGKLFPSREQLAAGSSHPTEALDYNDFLAEVKYLIKNVLNLDVDHENMKNFIIGTHTLKKTAHLLAYWGCHTESGMRIRSHDPLDESNVQQSARHS